MRVIEAPNPTESETEAAWDTPYVFLAGSIEMGRAVDWQAEVIEAVADLDGVLLNPRRADWDSSWEQRYDNPQFFEQVNWELDGMNDSDLTFFYFAPGTQSPITIGEFYQQASQHEELVVVCPQEFWRRGNIEVTARYWGFEGPIYETLEDGIAALRYWLARY